MLTTTRRRTPRATLTALLMALLCLGWGLPATTVAAADPVCELVEVTDEAGRTHWVEQCRDDDGDDGGNDGGDNGGNPPPSCDLSVFDNVHDGATRWCEGTTACWGNFPSVLNEDIWEDTAGPRPGPDHIVTYVRCVDENGNELTADWQWTLPPEEQGPSLWDLAWLAHGQLETPAFDIAISPPDTTYVGLDTWFWADGPAAEVISGSSGSVTAIAEPDHVEVRPGDNSGAFTCDFEVAENDNCVHSYARASGDGGYPAQMRLVYSLRFTNGGDALTLEGLPTTLESPWVGEAIPVGEIQGTVVG